MMMMMMIMMINLLLNFIYAKTKKGHAYDFHLQFRVIKMNKMTDFGAEGVNVEGLWPSEKMKES